MNILITGASEGIGLEVARQLAAKNNTLTLVARSKEKLEKAVASLAGSGHQYFVADLSTKNEVHLLKDKMEATHYDVFINNAGVGMYGRFTDMPLHDQVKMMDLNITAVTALSYFYLKQARKGDALVNMASTLGTSSFPGLATYSATKAYVISFSESLWWENKKRGVYVLGFCPGVTSSSFHETANGSKDEYPKFIVQTPKAVATELIRALGKRKKPKVVSGSVNRFMLSFQRLLSRKIVVNMMGSFSPLNKQKQPA